MNFSSNHDFSYKSAFLGSGPDRGRSPVEWGEIPSVRPSVPPLAGPQTLLAGPQTPPAGPQTLLAGPQTPPASPLSPLNALRPLVWKTDGWTYGRTDGRTEFLPILQDFVPCRGRCPATL